MLPPQGLMVGLPAKTADAIVATGTARIVPFSIIAPPGPHKVTSQQVGASALAGNVEWSLDGQTTWKVLVAFDFIATATVAFDAVPGAAYRFNVTTLTTTPADIISVLN